MKKAAAKLMGVVLLFVCSAAAFAQKPAVVTDDQKGWQKIGETTASFKTQNESIVVMGADRFNAIKLKVTDAPIRIDRMQVFYESGQMQDVKVDHEMQAGDETQVIPLEQKDDDIRKVAFTYRTLPNYQGEKAHVELHGLKGDLNDASDSYRNDPYENPQDDSSQDTSERSDTDDAGDQIRNDASRFGNEVDSAADRTGEETDTAYQESSDYIRQKTNQADSAADQAGDRLNEAAENTEDDIENGAERVKSDVKQSADSASDDISNATDQVYQGKVGPDGETVYIDRETKYYYINHNGKKVYVTRYDLKDKKRD